MNNSYIIHSSGESLLMKRQSFLLKVLKFLMIIINVKTDNWAVGTNKGICNKLIINIGDIHQLSVLRTQEWKPSICNDN